MEFKKPTKAQLTRHLNKLSNDKLGDDYAYIMSADLDRSIYWANDKEFRPIIIERLVNQILIHWNSKNLENNLTEIGYLNKSSIKKQSVMPTKKPSAKQLAARKKFAEIAKSGELAKKRATATKKTNSAKTPAEAKKRVNLKLQLKAYGYDRSKTINMTTKQLETLLAKHKGLKKPVTKGLTTLCAKTVGTTGRRKSNGSVKKGYLAKKGGKVVAVKKKTTVKKK